MRKFAGQPERSRSGPPPDGRCPAFAGIVSATRGQMRDQATPMPSAVTTHSPIRRDPSGVSRPVNDRATVFSGCPAKRWRKCSLQSISNPQLAAGCSSAMATPFPAVMTPTVRQSPPRPAGSAERQNRGRGAKSPSAVARRSSPSAFHPSQRCRTCRRTPACRKRCSQARNSGAAFMPVGNTRPELPTAVSMPSCPAHRRSWSGKGLQAGAGSAAAGRSGDKTPEWF